MGDAKRDSTSPGPVNQIVVSNPRKDGHVTYEVTTYLQGAAPMKVRRRYNHFLWLRNTLKALKPGHPIPSLPPKTDIISKVSNLLAHKTDRIEGLGWFVNSVLYSPHLARTPVFRAFLKDPAFDAFQATESKKVKGLDPYTIITSQYPKEYNALRSYSPPTPDQKLISNPNIVKLEAFITNYSKTLKTLLKFGQKSIDALAKSVEALEPIAESIKELGEQELKGPFRPSEYKRLDLTPVILGWKELLETRPGAFTDILNTFSRDMFAVEGIQEVLAFRAGLGKKLTVALKTETRYQAKPPANEQQQTKRNENLMLMRNLAGSITITDRLLIAYHIPEFLEDVQHRFRYTVTKFAKNQCDHAKKGSRLWHGFAVKHAAK